MWPTAYRTTTHAGHTVTALDQNSSRKHLTHAGNAVAACGSCKSLQDNMEVMQPLHVTATAYRTTTTQSLHVAEI